MDNDERLARIQARARAARRSYWRGWALRQGAFKRGAERIAAALATHAVLTTAALGATADAAVSRWLELAQQETKTSWPTPKPGACRARGWTRWLCWNSCLGKGRGNDEPAP